MADTNFDTSMSRRFFVTAIQPMQAAFLINPGDHILIDPDKLPEPGKMVLIGNHLEWWEGQQDIRGVAVKVEKDI